MCCIIFGDQIIQIQICHKETSETVKKKQYPLLMFRIVKAIVVKAAKRKGLLLSTSHLQVTVAAVPVAADRGRVDLVVPRLPLDGVARRRRPRGS